ncbi:MAG TPA: 50S ribosomal protein L24 [Candidatus Paceibacterota bacterium]
MKLKKNDNVILIAGKDKGKKGKIIRVLPKENKIVVEGLNMMKKHQRPRKSGEKGSMISIAMPINASNAKKADK